MEEKKKTQIQEMKEDATEFAEIWTRIPKNRRDYATGMLEGFIAGVSIEENKSA